MQTLRNRHEFITLRDKGLKQVTPVFILQAFARGDNGAPRYGLTASKKTGNAVRRNRARRRMRALIRHCLAEQAQTGWDYGLIARYDMADVAFEDAVALLNKAIVKIHSKAVPKNTAKHEPASKGL